jgi:CRISPR-associated protein Csx17
MHELALAGCTATPFGSYLKALGVFRLVAEQKDSGARGRRDGDRFTLSSELTPELLVEFFLEEYRPTPILAPWNGGSGFYPKDNQDGIAAIEGSSDARFEEYRAAIAICRAFDEVQAGKGDDENERRTAILRRCRNELPDRAVEWLDAAVGIAADGSRSFAPVLGTGGNEGRLDYTNNFMSRVAALLIAPETKTPVAELLTNALFGGRTAALQPGAAGQFDPGRAGGANQGPGISQEAPVNPWDLVLTLEGAVAWASGIYRRQGTAYRSFLCSPFTVRSRTVGYGSAAAKDDARAEVWTPLWSRPVPYGELKSLLREGRATVDGKPASNTLEFAEAACSLGVDRGIERFVRYSLLKRRGDSYVALPAGTFPVQFRSEADLIRKLQLVRDRVADRDLPKGTEDLLRGVDSAMYHALLTPGRERMREVMATLGRLLRRIALTGDSRLPARTLAADPWLTACGFDECVEVRIAAALASMWTPGLGSMSDHLTGADNRFAWRGVDLCARMTSVLNRRLQLANANELRSNPLGSGCTLDAGDATLFLERSVDDALIEDLLFAFVTLDWEAYVSPKIREAEVLPTYAVLKALFLPGEIRVGPEPKTIRADARIVTLLSSGDIQRAAEIAVTRLRIAGLRPLEVDYCGGVDARRLAAVLLIPVRPSRLFGAGILHPREETREAIA